MSDFGGSDDEREEYGEHEDVDIQDEELSQGEPKLSDDEVSRF